MDFTVRVRHLTNHSRRRVYFRNALTKTVFAVVSCAFASLGWAQDEPSTPEGNIEVGLGHTDNLNRDSEDLKSNIGTLGVGFAGQSNRRWLRAALAADIEYRKYDAEELVDDDHEVLGSADGLLELHAVPDKLYWKTRASYGQVRIDVVGAVGPSNRQQTSSFSTGPEIVLPLGDRTSLRAGGSISNQSYEVTEDLDSESIAARLGLERQIDAVTKLSLVGETRDIEYELDGQTHDISTLSLEYRRELASGEAFVSIGQGRVAIDDVDSDPVVVGRLVWNRALGARSRIEICAGREITDAGSAFVGAGVAVGCPGDFSSLASIARTTDSREQGAVVTTNPLVRAGGSLTFQIDSELGDLRATFSLAQDRFEEDATYDNDSTIFELSGSRTFAQHWRAEITARLWIQDFLDLDDNNEDQFIRVSISRVFARKMYVTLSFDHYRRVDGVKPFDSNDYFLSFGRDFGR